MSHIWLVLTGVEASKFSEEERSEILRQLETLLALVEVPGACAESEKIPNGNFAPDQRLVAWESWFRGLPASTSPRASKPLRSLEIEVWSREVWLSITVIVSTIALTNYFITLSGSAVLEFPMYIFRRVLAAGLIVGSLFTAFLADWVGQARLMGVCYGVLFLCWRASTGILIQSWQLALDSILSSLLLGGVAWGVASISVRLSDSIIRSMAFNLLSGIISLMLLVRMMVTGF